MTTEWIELDTLLDVARVQSQGWEIEVLMGDGSWEKWNGRYWGHHQQYRGRPAQPKMKKMKMLCWTDGEDLYWKPENHPVMHWQRFPTGDIEGEVPA
jgi:hypothetical protein